MPRLVIEHTTIQHYRRPVTLGVQQVMLRPRDSHDLRLIDTRMVVAPEPLVTWRHDVFGNSVAELRFAEPAGELKIISILEIEHFGLDSPRFPVDEGGAHHPVTYRADEVVDLASLMTQHYPDPAGVVLGWARRFLQEPVGTPTQDLLISMADAIRTGFTYQVRTAPGVQSPIETLTMRSGTCRDFAMLMIEGLRALGFAARFVSGYLYDPDLDTGHGRYLGAGASHAWVQVFLPGAGWVEICPTNGLYGGANLIRVAVARHAGQAMPFRGTFYGEPGDLERQTVSVRVRAVHDGATDAALPAAAS